MPGKAKKSELAATGVYDVEDLGDRILRMMPAWNGERWMMWADGPDGQLVPMQVVDVQADAYLAKEPRRSTDLHFPFAEFVWQRASWRPVADHTMAITDDLQNLAASLAKIDFFWERRNDIPNGLDLFVKTEVEYVLIVARSVLDHLHGATASLWKRIRLIDDADRSKQQSLPIKASKMCLSEGRPVEAERLHQKYGLPPPIASFYGEFGNALVRLRGLRDAVVHKGRDIGPIYIADRGFAIDRRGPLYRIAPEIWREGDSEGANLLTLGRLLAYVAMLAIGTCVRAANDIQCCIQFPSAVAPDYRVFFRAAHQDTLLRYQEMLRDLSAWWEPPAA